MDKTSEVFVSRLRAHTSTRIWDSQGRRSYDSYYLLSHYYHSNDNQGDTSRIRAEAKNEWRRLYLSNWYQRQNDYGNKSARAQSRLRWSDSIGPYLKYNLGLRGNYKEREGSSETSYGMNGGISSSVTKAASLSPRLTSVYSMNGVYSASASRAANGETNTDNAWFVRASEQLNSTHIIWLPLFAKVNTGYSQSGVPLSLTIGGHSRGFKKLTLSSGYSYGTFFPRGGGSRRVTQKLDFKADYVFRYNLSGYFEADRSWTKQKQAGGDTDKWGQTNYNADMSWRPTHRSSLNAKSLNSVSDDGKETHRFTSLYSLALRRGSNFAASLDWQWEKDFGKRSETLLMSYGLKHRRLSFLAEYTRKTSGGGVVENSLMLRATRTFGRRLRM